MSRSGVGRHVYDVLRWAYRPAKVGRHALRCCIARGAARRVVCEYLSAGRAFSGLQIGCGPHRLEGWLNSDLLGNPKRELFIDIAEPLPIPDGSLDAVYASEVIEHVPTTVAHAFLREAARVLKRDGVLRLTTPDLEAICRLYLGEHPEATIEQFGGVWRAGLFTPDAWVNGQFRDHGHQFIWSGTSLRDALAASGFADIVRPAPRQTRSNFPQLAKLERHYGPNLPEWVFARTLIIEAAKTPSLLARESDDATDRIAPESAGAGATVFAAAQTMGAVAAGVS